MQDVRHCAYEAGRSPLLCSGVYPHTHLSPVRSGTDQSLGVKHWLGTAFGLQCMKDKAGLPVCLRCTWGSPQQFWFAVQACL